MSHAILGIYLYLKKLFIIYLQLRFHWVAWILVGNLHKKCLAQYLACREYTKW